MQHPNNRYFTASDMAGVQVTAYSTEPDPLFKEMLPGLPGKAVSKVWNVVYVSLCLSSVCVGVQGGGCV